LNIGTIRNLSRERFEVVVASAQRPNDSFAEQFVKAADEYVVLDGKLRSASEQLQALELDVLFFTDVEMDPMTFSLAFTRSALIQCVTWGHPVTTGGRFMDYFISSELLEVSDAQDHYTEKLVKLPDLAVFYTPPKLTRPLPNRKDFGFTADQNLYGCLQTLFKFHPEFDEIIAGILQQDRKGHLLLI